MALFGKKKEETPNKKAERLIAMRRRLMNAIMKNLDGKLRPDQLSNMFYTEVLKNVPREYLSDDNFTQGFAPLTFPLLASTQLFYVEYERARQSVLSYYYRQEKAKK